MFRGGCEGVTSGFNRERKNKLIVKIKITGWLSR